MKSPLHIITLLLLCISYLSTVAQINRSYTYRQPDPEAQKKKKKKEIVKFETKGLEYGFNFGMYKADNQTANYFNGASGANLLEDIIGKDLYAGSISGTPSMIHEQVKELLGGYEFHIYELPKNMRYDPAVLIGFHGKVNVTEKTGIYIDFNYAKLRTIDQFSIETENYPAGFISQKALQFFPIQGMEKRYDINIGVMQCLTDKRFAPYVEGALNYNNLHVDDAAVYIKEQYFSFLNPYNSYYKVRDYGGGYGALVGVGGRLLYTQGVFINIGYNLSYKLINLGVYKNNYFNHTIYLRFNFWQKIWKAEEIER